jgi:Lon protease-like protein
VERGPLAPDERTKLAIFPLPGTVLFPNTVVPLHVFEPRYRALVEDCLEAKAPLAVWQLDPGAGETERGPGIRQVATAGRIAVHHRFPDGRYNVVIEGVERVRLVTEHDSQSAYRVVQAERHPLEATQSSVISRKLETISGIARCLSVEHSRAARLVQVTLRRLSQPNEISDVLCSLAFDEGPDRQKLLELSRVPDRLDRVIDSLSALLLGGPDEAGNDVN